MLIAHGFCLSLIYLQHRFLCTTIISKSWIQTTKYLPLVSTNAQPLQLRVVQLRNPSDPRTPKTALRSGPPHNSPPPTPQPLRRPLTIVPEPREADYSLCDKPASQPNTSLPSISCAYRQTVTCMRDCRRRQGNPGCVSRFHTANIPVLQRMSELETRKSSMDNTHREIRRSRDKDPEDVMIPRRQEG